MRTRLHEWHEHLVEHNQDAVPLQLHTRITVVAHTYRKGIYGTQRDAEAGSTEQV